MPFIYMSSAALLILVGLAYSRLETAVSAKKLLVVTTGLLLISIVGFYLSASLAGPRGLALGLMIWKEVLYVLSSLAFWALAGLLFDVRQGKRLFGLIASGFVLANVLGGVLAAAVVRKVGTLNLLILSAAGMALALLLLPVIFKRSAGRLEAPGSSEPEAEKASIRGLVRDRFLRILFAASVLSFVAFYFIDFIFYDRVAARFTDDLSIARFFGLFYAVLGLLNLAANALVSGRLLERFGVGFGLLTLPAVLSLGVLLGLSTLFLPGGAMILFWILAATKLGHELTEQSMEVPAFQILYQALPVGKRLKAQAVRESIIGPAATGLVGLLLLGLTAWLSLSVTSLLAIVGVLLIPWFVVGVALRKTYMRALTGLLSRRRLKGAALSLADASSVAVLKKGLGSGDPFEVLASLNMLEDIEHKDLPKFLTALLGHPDPDVRRDVLGRIEGRNLTAALPAVTLALERERQPRVRAAALRTYARLGGPDAVESVLPYLEHPDADIRGAAAAGLLRGGGENGAQRAETWLLQWSRSANPADRRLAARAMGDVGRPELVRALVALLGDADLDVRREAVAAAGRIRQASLWPSVVRCLDQPELRSAAIDALAAGAEGSLPALLEAFEARAIDRQARVLILRALARIPGAATNEYLRERAEEIDQEVSYQALRALQVRGYRAEGDHRAAVSTKILSEAEAAAGVFQARGALPQGEYWTLLKLGLEGHFDQRVKRILILLSFLYDPATIRKAADHILFRTESRDIARALEVIDNTIARDLKRVVLPLIEEAPLDERRRRLAKIFPAAGSEPSDPLEEIFDRARGWGEAWLQACVLYSAAMTREGGGRNLVERGRGAADRLVRETAAWAAGRLAPVAGGPRTVPDGEPGAAADFPKFERIVLLKNTRLFAETREEILAMIADVLDVVRIEAGTVVVREGEIDPRMYVIVKGRVGVRNLTGTNLTLGAGDIFGETALFEDAARTATVHATDATFVFRIHRDHFREIMAERTEVAFGLIRVLCRRLRQKLGAKQKAIQEKDLPVSPPGASPDRLDIETLLPPEKLLLLKSVALFSEVPRQALSDIAALLSVLKKKPGERIIEKGDVGRSLYIIVSGHVRIHDEARTFAHLGAKDVFGELSALDSEERMASVTAIEETHLFELAQDALYEIMADRAELAAAIIGGLARRVREEEEILAGLARADIEASSRG